MNDSQELCNIHVAYHDVSALHSTWTHGGTIFRCESLKANCWSLHQNVWLRKFHSWEGEAVRTSGRSRAWVTVRQEEWGRERVGEHQSHVYCRRTVQYTTSVSLINKSFSHSCSVKIYIYSIYNFFHWPGQDTFLKSSWNQTPSWNHVVTMHAGMSVITVC